MQKRLINLYVPGLAKNFDILAPADLQIRRLIPVLIEGINGLSNGSFVPSGKEMLVADKANAVLDPDRALMNYSVQDGDKVILM